MGDTSNNIWNIESLRPGPVVGQGLQEAYLKDPTRVLPKLTAGWETRQRDRTELPYPSNFYEDGNLRLDPCQAVTWDQLPWFAEPSKATGVVRILDFASVRQNQYSQEDGLPLNGDETAVDKAMNDPKYRRDAMQKDRIRSESDVKGEPDPDDLWGESRAKRPRLADNNARPAAPQQPNAPPPQGNPNQAEEEEKRMPGQGNLEARAAPDIRDELKDAQGSYMDEIRRDANAISDQGAAIMSRAAKWGQKAMAWMSRSKPDTLEFKLDNLFTADGFQHFLNSFQAANERTWLSPNRMALPDLENQARIMEEVVEMAQYGRYISDAKMATMNADDRRSVHNMVLSLLNNQKGGSSDVVIHEMQHLNRLIHQHADQEFMMTDNVRQMPRDQLHLAMTNTILRRDEREVFLGSQPRERFENYLDSLIRFGGVANMSALYRADMLPVTLKTIDGHLRDVDRLDVSAQVSRRGSNASIDSNVSIPVEVAQGANDPNIAIQGGAANVAVPPIQGT